MRAAPDPPRAQITARTAGSHQARCRSPARCSSVPARCRRRSRACAPTTTSSPQDSSTATPRSSRSGTRVPLGATTATRSPRVSRRARSKRLQGFGGVGHAASGATSRGSTWPIGSRRRADAIPSYGVGSRLTTTSRAPARTATSTRPAAGCTVSVLPTASSRSQSRAAARLGLQHGGLERLAERDGRRLLDAAADQAVRVVLAGLHPVEVLAHRRGPAALQALHVVQRAVDLQHPVRVVAGPQVQPVDVLGDDGPQPAGPSRGRPARGGRRSARPARRGGRAGRARSGAGSRGRAGSSPA